MTREASIPQAGAVQHTAQRAVKCAYSMCLPCTGVKGEPGKPCQEVYQPAAQAEERLRQGLAALQVRGGC